LSDPAEMIDWMDRRIRSAEGWLEDHGRRAKRPWPEHVIEAKENDVAKFRELRGAYVRALEARRERA
jgi:hypothetical protein